MKLNVRYTMKWVVTLCVLPLLLVGLAGCSNRNAEPPAQNAPVAASASQTKTSSFDKLQGKKVLVAYFSWSGDNRKVAQYIHSKVGGDLVEIVPQKAYPTNYGECTDVAKQELADKARPALKTKVDNFKQYDVVFLGQPVWWGKLPMPVYTFIESYDWTGKTVVPFMSHGGGGEYKLDDEIKTATKAKTLSMLVLASAETKNADMPKTVDAWLQKLAF